MRAFLLVLIGLVSISAHGRLSAESNYWMYVFGYGGHLPARDSHTFALFVHNKAAHQEHFTISWLPYSGSVDPIGVYPGRNFTFEQTLRLAGNIGVSFWGPVPIPADLYAAALRQSRYLNSGDVAYAMIDSQLSRGLARLRPLLRRRYPGGVKNCIHAVSDIGGSFLPTGASWGEPASYQVLLHLMRRWRIHPRISIPLRRVAAGDLRLGNLLFESVPR